MGGFLGSHLNQVDEKGRVTLPAAFRRGSETASLVMVHVYADALTLYPSDRWAEVELRIREHLKRAPSRRLEVLAITANAQEVTPDKQGRILIPERLRSGAGIEGEALLVGAIDRIEIWSPDRFEAALESQPGDLGEIAGSLFA